MSSSPTGNEATTEGGSPSVSDAAQQSLLLPEEYVQHVLYTLRQIAGRSAHGQADFDAALKRAGRLITGQTRLELLARLEGASHISNIIHLADGGILLTILR